MVQSSTAAFPHDALAVVLQVREGALQVLLWQRAREPLSGRWALPGGRLGPRRDVEASMRRHLAEKVDVREVAHVEQLGVALRPGPPPEHRRSPPPTSASCPPTPTRRFPTTPRGTRSTRCRRRRSTTGRSPAPAVDRLRAKLSYTNLGFALAPDAFTISELRDLYAAALGHPVSATNLHRVLLRRGLLVPTGEHRAPGPAAAPGSDVPLPPRGLEITDQFAVLRLPSGR